MTTSLLVEQGLGLTHTEERSSSKGLEHMQADGPGLEYLFFHNRHGYHSLSKEEALAMRSHISDAFAKWIGRSAHFDVVPLLLEAGQQCTTAMQEKCRQCV